MKFYFLLFILITRTSFLWAIDTKAEQAVVLDSLNNEIIFEKNANQKVIPASMTKIMTIYVLFDRLNNTQLTIGDICNVSAKAYNTRGSRTFLEVDDQVTIADLIRGIVIQSGNDASVAIAECLSGTEESFAKLMNFHAEKLLMKNTNFQNSHGLPEDNHYSTVFDIAILSNALISEFPDLYTYFQEKEFTYNNIPQPNRNKLLGDIVGLDGLKTGYTKKSGWGISASAIRDNRRITVVINGTNSSRSRLIESSNLINWAFTQTTQKILAHKDQIIKKVDVWLGSKPTVNLVVEKDIVSILSFDQLKLIKSTIQYVKPISAPIKAGEKIGSLIINISSKPPMIVPLVADKNINTINPIMRIFAAIKYLVFGTSLDEI